MEHRAYAILEVKDLSEDRRTLSGIATTPTPDRVGDVIEPLGVQVAPVIPLLLFHDATKVVGSVRFGTPTKTGVPFVAQLPFIDEPGALKDRVDEAWGMVKHKLITAVSIGFRAIGKVESLASGGLRFLQTEVIELSLVPIPAQIEATITSVKALDHARQFTRAAHTNSQGNSMKAMAAVTVSNRLELEIQSYGPGGKSCSVRLNRIMAQHLADALLEYAGAVQKSADRGRITMVGAEDLTAHKAAPGQSRVVRLEKPKTKSVQSRVVRL